MDELIILKYFDKTASQAEMTAIEEWLGQSNANQKEFDRLKQIWRTSSQLKDYQTFDKKAAWAKVQAAIEEEQTNREEREIRRIPLLEQNTSKSNHHFVLRIAAILLIFFMVGFVFYQSYFNGESPNALVYKTVESEDSILKIPLSDGSIVWLNQHSTLEYPSSFSSDLRMVKLKGEAFFEVEEDKRKPFVIEAGEANVKVLGTSFNVINREKTPIEVTVESGKVQFYSKEDKTQEVILVKEEKG
ncbi:MAG: FecR family protein, partial [Chitinophagales bacterium]